MRVRTRPATPPRRSPEPTRAPCDLRELPRLERPTVLAVELRRLREEERLAGKVDPVPEHVGRDADVSTAREEAIDLLPPGRQRHRPVEHGDPVGPEPVHLAREGEHGLPAEADAREAVAEFVPFTARTRMSGIDLDRRQVRKGAGGAVVAAEDPDPAVRKAAARALEQLRERLDLP